MRSAKIVAGICLILWSMAADAQSRTWKKANEHYKNGEYTAAMPLYEAILQEKDNSVAKTKLAYCYRMNNQLAKAEALYRALVADKRVKPIVLYYYGEILMTNEKYEAAKNWFKKYAALEPDDERVALMIASCEAAPHIQPFFENINLQPFNQNSEADDNSPAFWAGGIVFSSDRNAGLRFLKQKSGWTGRDFIRLYYSEEKEPGSFESPANFSNRLNELNKNTGNASFSYDSSIVYFTRNSNTLNRRSTYNLQLFEAHHEGDNKWSGAEVLEFCTDNSNYMHPAITPEGNTLFFVSDKPGGEGGTDIYMVEKSESGWGRNENLGTAINTPANEGFPFIDKNGRLFFCSKGHPGFGGFDIFVTEKDDKGNWKKPVNLGKPINSSYDDISIFLEKTGQRGLFTSARDGGDDDIYLFYLPDSSGLYAGIPEGLIEKIAADSLESPSASPSHEEPRREQTRKKSSLKSPTEISASSSQSADASEPLQVKSNDTVSEKRKVGIGQTFILENIKYGIDEYVVTDAIATALDEWATFLKKNPKLKIEIGGHTEKLGDDKNNLVLSRYRAEAAAAYLIEKGIGKERISAVGYGEQFPLNNCATEDDCDWEQHLENQRLELKILSD